MSLIEPTTISRLADRRIGSPVEVVPAGSRREARDGAVLWWGTADTPGPPQVVSAGLPTPITVAVSPVRPGHTVAVEYRSNGGPVRRTIAFPVPGLHNATLLPGQPSGLVEFLPVLRFAGQPISPRLTEAVDCPRYQVGGVASPVPTASAAPPRPRVLQRHQRSSWRASRAGTGVRNFSGPAPSVSAKR